VTAVFAVPCFGDTQNPYPNRTIKVIVPFPAGSTADYLARLVGHELAQRWRQPVIVENRPGAGGNLGAQAVAMAQPDGYTFLASPPPPVAINQSLFSKLAFDPEAFVPITVIATAPNVLLVHPKVPVSNLAQLIDHIRAHPGELSYASFGNGGTPHLSMEQLKTLAGLRIVHVPYTGPAQAFIDLIPGRVDLMFANLAMSLAHIRSGKLKALAIGSEQPVADLPGVPTLSVTFPGFVSDTWTVVVAPPRTPREIAAKLASAIAEIVRMPEIGKALRERSLTPVGGSPDQTATFLRNEARRWRQVIESAGVKPD
jgi:tripartite-type tricarboxylate transporter receptor subunit TctC